MKYRLFAYATTFALFLAFTARTSTTDIILVDNGAVWKYRDQGTNEGTAWRAPAFNDSGWASGPAQLGYGDGDEATVVSYGPDINNKYVTTYFRHTFNVGDPGAYQSLTLSLMRDDGAVAYLNGTEVFRTNMPSGAIAYNTFAGPLVIGGADESAFQTATISPSLLVAGSNVLAVEVHQANGTSSDISFVARLVASTSLQITRGPYLQMGTPSSVVVRWRTGGNSDSRVMYGTDPSSLTLQASSATSTTEHEITVPNLLPGTAYYYSVGSSTQTLAGGDANHFFVTSPSSGTAVPTRVWVLGDSGTADANARAVRDAYYTFAGATHTNLWLMLGDNAYEQGLDNEYQAAVFDMYPTMLRKSVMWPTLGNHDGAAANSQTQSGPYYDMFTLPKNREAGTNGLASGTEAYYSFDYGNIHFICLESFETDRSAAGPMMTWLQSDMASTSQDWIVAFFHHPPYSKGSHDSDAEIELQEMRQNALPILEAGGVDLVLSGHSHSYERSFLIDGHYGTSSTLVPSMIKDGGSGQEEGSGAYQKTPNPAPHDGAVYTVAGSSGKISGGLLNHPAMFVSLNVLGSMVLDVNSDRLDAKFIDNLGAIRDHFTIVKGSPTAPTITTTTLPNGTVGSAYSTTLAATGGTQPYTWDLASGQLPAGLALAPGTGIISGTPSGPAGTSTFEARVTGQDSLSSTKTFSLDVNASAPPPTIVTTSLPGGFVGVAYSQTLQATGGVPPYTWSRTAGTLPAGLSLASATGVISGTPTTAGTSSFTVQVLDSQSPAGSAQGSLSIAIAGVPGSFGKSSPANFATNQSTSPTLSWAASADATSYEYCIDTSKNNSCGTTWVSTGTALQAVLSGLSHNRTYYWQVRARNPAGTRTANGGSWWRFKTVP